MLKQSLLLKVHPVAPVCTLSIITLEKQASLRLQAQILPTAHSINAAGSQLSFGRCFFFSSFFSPSRQPCCFIWFDLKEEFL